MKIFGSKDKAMIGLDIGTHSVKLVYMMHRNGKHQLLSAVEEPAVSESGPDEDARVKAVQKAFQRAGLKPGRGDAVVTAVSGSGTAVKQVEFPLLTDEELQSSIKWQAGKRLPFGPDEAVLDYQVVGRDETAKKMRVLLVAVTRVYLSKHLDLLGKAGVDPLIIDLGPLALANAVMGTQELEEDKAVAVLDVGASNTILDVFAPGEFFFTRDIAVTGRQLASEKRPRKKDQPQKDVASERKAETGQPKTDTWATKSNGQTSETAKTHLDRLVFEIRRSLTYYENRRGRDGFQKLYLAGGGIESPDLSEHLRTRLGVAVEKFNPLNSVDAGSDQDHLLEMAPRLTLAFGLALRKAGQKHV
jgi:type IV pilus assembly protein PilM